MPGACADQLGELFHAFLPAAPKRNLGSHLGSLVAHGKQLPQALLCSPFIVVDCNIHPLGYWKLCRVTLFSLEETAQQTDLLGKVGRRRGTSSHPTIA